MRMISKKTDCILNGVTGFIAGAFFSAVLIFVVYFLAGAVAFARAWTTFEPVHLSSSAIIREIEAQGISVPDNAHGLEYFFISGKDHECWIGFSGANSELEASITTFVSRKKEPNPLWTPNAPRRPEYWDSESSRGSWWSADFDEMKIFKGNFYWIAHDTIGQRLYLYTFSM